jgi:hypothetical protein
MMGVEVWGLVRANLVAVHGSDVPREILPRPDLLALKLQPGLHLLSPRRAHYLQCH